MQHAVYYWYCSDLFHDSIILFQLSTCDLNLARILNLYFQILYSNGRYITHCTIENVFFHKPQAILLIAELFFN